MITPHLGASTEEASLNVSTAVAKLVSDSLKGEMVPAVNMPHIKVKNLSELRPYLNLGEILGKIYYQIEKDAVNEIEVIYYGDLVEKETSVITLAVLKGFLSNITSENVNFVNTSNIIKDMGINTKESKSSHLDKYTNLITVKFISKNKSYSVSGTIFAKEEIRIVDFFGYKLDFDPTPFVLAINNIDKPGIVGKVGTVLGENNINIASMQLSRNTRGDVAASFLSVDMEVGKEVLEKIRNIDGVLKASIMRF